MKKIKNTRKHPRHSWNGTVTYRRPMAYEAVTMKEIGGQGELRNVSNGGLCLVTTHRLVPKQCLVITVPLAKPGVSIPTLAYVQWTRTVSGKRRYAAGLSFLV